MVNAIFERIQSLEYASSNKDLVLFFFELGHSAEKLKLAPNFSP